MSTLIELADNTRTDKNTVHSYLGLYETLLRPRKETAKNVLEVGIHRGGSIKMWADYFTNATVHALDIIDEKDVWGELKNKPNIKLYTSSDAYNEYFFRYALVEKNIKFDFMLDDGPHTLESQKKFVAMYSQLIADGGILSIEDVQWWSWVEELKACVPDNLKDCVEIYDLRKNKDRQDDNIVFTINRNK